MGKKILSLVLIFTIISVMNTATSIVTANDIKRYGQLEYVVKDGTVTITKVDSDIKNVTIPSKIEGYRVKFIDNMAFHQSSVENLIIEDGIPYFGNNCFSECKNLKTCDLPKSLNSIMYGGFSNCEKLESVVIRNSDILIGEYAFYGCKNLKDIYFTGNEKEWRTALWFTTSDDGLENATIHYNYKEELPKPISVYLNDNKIEFDVPPIIEENRTLVPLRAIFEAMGMVVDWDSSTSTITAAGQGNSISMRINEITATVNGETLTMDVPSKVIDGRTLVPVRFIAESLGAKVDWNKENRSVYIKYTFDENYKIFTVNNSDKIEAYKFESGYYVDSSTILPLLSGYDDKYNELSGILKIWDEGVNVGLSISYNLTSNKEGDYVTAEVKCSDGTWLKDSLYKKHYKKTNVVMTRKGDKSYINLDDITWLTNYTTDYEYAEIYPKGVDDSVAYLIGDDGYSNPEFNDGVNKWVFDAEHFSWTDEQLKKYMNNQEFWGNVAQGALSIYDLKLKNMKVATVNSMVDVLVMPSEHQMSENIQSKFSLNETGDVMLDFTTMLHKTDDFLLEGCELYETMSEKSKSYCKSFMGVASDFILLADANFEAQQELLKIQAVLECSEDNRLRLKKFIDDLPQKYKDENKRTFELMSKRLNEYDDYSYGILFCKELARNLLSDGTDKLIDFVINKAGDGKTINPYAVAQFALDCTRFAIDGLASEKLKGMAEQGVFHALYDFSVLTNDYYTELWNQRNQYLHDYPTSYQEKMKNAAIFTIKSGNDARRMFVQAREEIMTAKQREDNYAGHESILSYCNVSDSVYLQAWTKAVVK